MMALVEYNANALFKLVSSKLRTYSVVATFVELSPIDCVAAVIKPVVYTLPLNDESPDATNLPFNDKSSLTMS